MKKRALLLPVAVHGVSAVKVFSDSVTVVLDSKGIKKIIAEVPSSSHPSTTDQHPQWAQVQKVLYKRSGVTCT